jgi:hypothetical protein
MFVKAWHNGKGTYGIRVGAKNRDKFFKSHWREIVVEVEGAAYSIRLTDGFWRDCPEFRDSRDKWIEHWFRRRIALPWPPYHPPTFQLVSIGEQAFFLSI